MAKTNPSPPTRLSIRDVRADLVWKVMRAHAHEIREARDVIRLAALDTMTGECIACAVADLVAQGRVVGGTGAGRIRAVEPA